MENDLPLESARRDLSNGILHLTQRGLVISIQRISIQKKSLQKNLSPVPGFRSTTHDVSGGDSIYREGGGVDDLT